ncbi:GNAT family N-acetyltransferase [Myroides marinus]|uniref:Acetyltransferase (GNAT) domain-containing protein n=1 Tax=Myroides marinus TaxID=703342 RepID=A0A163XKW2_9FLAO|nr:GNAT family N-acetyltransferase [Myroides marinus]KUF43257.1 GNAT family acetyltransferase [Myroides marinus]KZE78047.1 GNAT family acetyltransferase [Myroides marinus]MDM1371377.1 GNAT family N-acetyltransferase [Myroides marinus]MDM1379450.1 GNAT family N-acetyltransferase [Myroides marinus]MDM1381279.1 GNAT family N-acetyltransferase [Myroides marinus]
MLTIHKINKFNTPADTQIEQYCNFLYQHLEQYGDKKEDILKAIHYALAKNDKPGGFILYATDSNDNIVGIAVLLDTLMDGFIPEHILVYLAIDASVRGQGLGGQLLDRVKTEAKGSIALHVDRDNPAQNLYERKGFEKKYIEMRLTRE